MIPANRETSIDFVYQFVGWRNILRETGIPQAQICQLS